MVNQQRKLVFLLTVFCALPLYADEDVDPNNDGSQYVYAANLGWLNAEPQGDGGPGLRLSDTSADGWLWSANAGWISLNCSNTLSCGSVDYAVSHDGAGKLGGYGWAPNVGWISFSCEDASSCPSVDYGVVVDLQSGEISGSAYAANTGWVTFSCDTTASCGTVDYRLVIDSGPQPNEVFMDGFEG